MADIVIKERVETASGAILHLTAVEEDGTVLSNGRFTYTTSRFGKESVKTMLAGGVATPVHHRRGGNVRKMFDLMHQAAVEEGAAVALLHPFSFSYYRKFGYEKVSDHVIVRCPTRMIDFVPRRCQFVPYDESKLDDLIAVYSQFSRGRHLLPQRYGSTHYQDPERQIYLFYQDGAPVAYLIFSGQQKFIVNHMGDSLLTVHELCYTSPEALREIFSFLRMFEGEYDEIEFSNIAPCPEVELLLRHYMHTSYTVVSDVMAKTLNTEKMLLAADYPEKSGSFTVRVEDELPSVAGTFRVTYGGGACEVTRVDTAPDLILTSPAFTRLIYGYDGANAQTAKYMDGVTVTGCAEDFFLAFPKKPCGVFEHF